MIQRERLPEDIMDRLQLAADSLKSDENVQFAYLFGGLTSGRRPLSDVDIAVYLSDLPRTVGFFDYKLSLLDRLTGLLGTEELDLVILNTAPLSLVGRILQNRRILADRNPHLRHIYESVTLRKFFDFRVKENAYFEQRYGHG